MTDSTIATDIAVPKRIDSEWDGNSDDFAAEMLSRLDRLSRLTRYLQLYSLYSSGITQEDVQKLLDVARGRAI